VWRKGKREENAFGDEGIAADEVGFGGAPPAMTRGRVIYRRPDLYVF
jgi:hypothetical protein